MFLLRAAQAVCLGSAPSYRSLRLPLRWNMGRGWLLLIGGVYYGMGKCVCVCVCICGLFLADKRSFLTFPKPVR